MYQWLIQVLIIAYDCQHNLQSAQYSRLWLWPQSSVACDCHLLFMSVTVTPNFNCLWPWPQSSIAYDCHHNLHCLWLKLLVTVTNCLWLWLQFSFACGCHHNLQLLMAVTKIIIACNCHGKLKLLVTINYPKLQLLMTATFHNKLQFLLTLTQTWNAYICHYSF